MLKDKRIDILKDTILSLGLLIFSVMVACFIIPNYVADAGFSQVSPRFFPYVSIFVLGFCAALLLLVSLRQFIKLKYSTSLENEVSSETVNHLSSLVIDLKLPVIVMILLCVFVFLFQTFGYFVSVPFMLLSLMFVLGQQHLLKSCSIAVLMTGGVFVCFHYFLGFPLL